MTQWPHYRRTKSDGPLTDGNNAVEAAPARVKSAARVLRVIELLTDEPGPMTFAEIVGHLGPPKSSDHAVQQTMVNRGYLRLDPHTRTYSFGVRVWQTGQAYVRDFDLLALARPSLQASRDPLREAVELAILDGIGNVHIGKEDADQHLSLQSRVGGRLPAHGTGLGKVLLSGLPGDQLQLASSTSLCALLLRTRLPTSTSCCALQNSSARIVMRWTVKILPHASSGSLYQLWIIAGPVLPQ